jgi:Protein of unknown function DUF262
MMQMEDFFEDDESDKLLPAHKSSRSKTDIDATEKQITQNMRDVRYIIREYPVEVVVLKYLRGRDKDENEVYVPDYQRDLIWPEKHKSRFIESLLIGLPIPFLFVADVNDAEDPDKNGRIEIVDGVQRIRTLADFLTNNLVLGNLTRLDSLNGFRFGDLHPSRQRRFRRATVRLIELSESVSEDVRREMFDRINSGSVKLEAVEIRRGMQPGPFLVLATELATDPLLHQLAPISDGLKKRFEYEELVTRFFAFLNNYNSYGIGEDGKIVANFLLTYVKDTNKKLKGFGSVALTVKMRNEWSAMLSFVRDHFPDGFRKRGPGRKVPRVRFEAIAVGVALALRERSDLNTAAIATWLESPEFKDWTTSDASNNRANLKGRLEYVRDELLKP